MPLRQLIVVLVLVLEAVYFVRIKNTSSQNNHGQLGHCRKNTLRTTRRFRRGQKKFFFTR